MFFFVVKSTLANIPGREIFLTVIQISYFAPFVNRALSLGIEETQMELHAIFSFFRCMFFLLLLFNDFILLHGYVCFANNVQSVLGFCVLVYLCVRVCKSEAEEKS